MTTLISVHDSDGCIGRCDARCHEALYPDCDCVCGGMNHGRGHKQAAANTAHHAITIIDRWKAEDRNMIIKISDPQIVMF